MTLLFLFREHVQLHVIAKFHVNKLLVTLNSKKINIL